MMALPMRRFVCAMILMDSVAVFGECVVDAIIDDRKDVAGTWLHIAYLLDEGLKFVSACLMPLFALELVALTFCLGVSFFKNMIYIGDSAMVSLTILEELIRPWVGRRLEHSFSLLLRVWRVLRVSHGVFTVMALKQKAIEQELCTSRSRIASLEQELYMLRSTRQDGLPTLYCET